MRDLTEAQRQVLVVLLRLCLPGFTPGDLTMDMQWVNWSRVADALGYTGRGRAAVVGTLNRLVEGHLPLVAWGTEPEGDVVTLTQEGFCVAWELMPEDLPRYQITRGPGAGVEAILMTGGIFLLEVHESGEAILTGPRGLRVSILATTRVPLVRPSLQVRVIQEKVSGGEVANA
jgi:hypothetical protein